MCASVRVHECVCACVTSVSVPTGRLQKSVPAYGQRDRSRGARVRVFVCGNVRACVSVRVCVVFVFVSETQ